MKVIKLVKLSGSTLNSQNGGKTENGSLRNSLEHWLEPPVSRGADLTCVLEPNRARGVDPAGSGDCAVVARYKKRFKSSRREYFPCYSKEF